MQSTLKEDNSKNMVVPGDLTTMVVCNALVALLGEQKVALPGSAAFNGSVESYFSQQQQALHPACIVAPQTAQDVSAVVKTLTSQPGERTQFAIRSGGYASWAGASNIAGGVVIDIRALNSIEINPDSSTVSVGAGASWDDVYAQLDPIGLSVNGGRSAEVGISGLTLGGGISYFSPRYGWTCDTVTSIEIVLADGSIVETNANSDPDLFQALKGGNNNFGIVTRMDFTTFKQGLIWTGNVYQDLSIVDDVISELVKITSPDVYDEHASIITTFGFSQARGLSVISSVLAYTKEVETPPIYKDFLSLPNLMNTSSLANMTAASKTTRSYSPEHPRSINRVLTLKLTSDVIKAVFNQWQASLSGLQNVTNLMWALALEPIPPQIYARHAADNSLGLAGRDGTLVLALATISWTEASDDDVVNTAVKSLMDGIANEAQKLDGLDPFVYLNYADKDQDVMRSYGEASVSKLQAVRDRVDPEGVFTNQVRGGYKIPAQ
ncbi:hypothetical protein BJ166DRAFT_611763 [Pestalotiopsis sp. NC0098]|nr:hypothetical protein BJ166DRAFT_611763 [Pestalotiopsis sp. NC0098]